MEIWVYVVLFLQPRDVEKVQLNLQLCDQPTHTQQQKKRKKDDTQISSRSSFINSRATLEAPL